ncbi:MbnP family copper-binding protein [Thiolinea disciformis]|uniref:MbnP family copper-binding protein n=1 Tax=Thiolinea disciformis TaxID=125614 RepID=UPI00035CB606|nr:MbnP family copper-binding protein [Thiolinea disciformis]
MRQAVKLIIAPLALAVSLSACTSDDEDTSNLTSTITIPFAAKSGSTTIACGASLTNLGTTKDSGAMADFAFYVHDIQLKTSAGTWINAKLDDNNFQDPQYGVALLDFQDKTDNCNGAAKATNKSVSATITGAKVEAITGIKFTVGVPAAANHHNASVSRAPYNRSGLMWSWQSGHKFMRLDVSPSKKVLDSTGKLQNTFFFHLGSTGCSGDPTTGAVVTCTAPNRPVIELTSNFKITNLTTSTIVLDYAKLVSDSNLNIDLAPAIGCMSGVTDPECPSLFNNLGLAVGTTAATKKQQVFSIQ